MNAEDGNIKLKEKLKSSQEAEANDPIAIQLKWERRKAKKSESEARRKEKKAAKAQKELLKAQRKAELAASASKSKQIMNTVSRDIAILTSHRHQLPIVNLTCSQTGFLRHHSLTPLMRPLL
ncbi:unnamed protein product [Rhizophagus irregularis]|uniref:Uncharacterized protein n=1 Tax=Rhizophagus irregularis TaxID=588596 RepID=A0A2I1GVE5_9GLOM|nr:hypothetical protein RhiirA4_467176 [Rhizophagus irregularis]CAB4442347.1 unnamed protein product [Rhizophagus irregularis]CAB4442406.1 unnamed protein product [Rhizophagus irregularis]CAB4442410.1 unnamed protein product [Rhizophagus irregularis]